MIIIFWNYLLFFCNIFTAHEFLQFFPNYSFPFCRLISCWKEKKVVKTGAVLWWCFWNSVYISDIITSYYAQWSKYFWWILQNVALRWISQWWLSFCWYVSPCLQKWLYLSSRALFKSDPHASYSFFMLLWKIRNVRLFPINWKSWIVSSNENDKENIWWEGSCKDLYVAT